MIFITYKNGERIVHSESRPTSDLSLDELSDRIVQWGRDRGIIDNGNPQTQCLKLMSEVGELSDNIAKGRYEAAKDDLGDIVVVVMMIASQIDSDLADCLRVAWDDIKDRKGFLNSQGVFVKEGDYNTRPNALLDNEV